MKHVFVWFCCLAAGAVVLTSQSGVRWHKQMRTLDANNNNRAVNNQKSFNKRSWRFSHLPGEVVNLDNQFWETKRKNTQIHDLNISFNRWNDRHSQSVKRNNHKSELPFDVSLDSGGLLHLYWDVNYEKKLITFQIKSNFSIKEGNWVAVGFSDYGKLSNADLCIFWLDSFGNVHFKDIWTESDGTIQLDKKDDCHLLDFTKSLKETTITYQRDFDTCDNNDYVVEDGTTHVIFAYGDAWSIEHPNIQDSHNGLQRIQLLKEVNPTPALGKDVKMFDILNSEVHVPNKETTYWCITQQVPLLTSKHHIVKFEGVIQSGNEQLVHHMEVFHCEVKPGRTMVAYSGECHSRNLPKKVQMCKKVIGAWAMGAKEFVYPAEAGFPIGGADFSPYVLLEVHYNNPSRRSDWVDSSGIRFYYTSTLRQYDAGVMELGLEYTPKMAIPPGQPVFHLTGDCVSQCTTVGLKSSGIKIFASQLHTHLTGRRIWTKHVRDGVELPELNRDNHYSSMFQEIRILKREIHVLPGDALITTCEHDTLDRQNVTLGGWGIRDEMCVNYVHYYPRSELEVCKSSIDTDSLMDYFHFMHDYNLYYTKSNNSYEENYRSISWTPLQARLLQTLYDESPLSMQCNKSNGNRFWGNWSSLPQTEIRLPLKKEPQQCKLFSVYNRVSQPGMSASLTRHGGRGGI